VRTLQTLDKAFAQLLHVLPDLRSQLVKNGTHGIGRMAHAHCSLFDKPRVVDISLASIPHNTIVDGMGHIRMGHLIGRLS